MAKIKELEVSIGLSIDKNGLWVRGGTGIKIDIEPGDDIKACFKRAFEHADNALSEQMELYQGDKEEQ